MSYPHMHNNSKNRPPARLVHVNCLGDEAVIYRFMRDRHTHHQPTTITSPAALDWDCNNVNNSEPQL